MNTWRVAPNALRGRLFAVYMAVNFGALALGQWLILVGDRLGFVPFALVSVMFSFALLPITMTEVDEPEPVDAPLQILVHNTIHDEYIGKVAIGRVRAGREGRVRDGRGITCGYGLRCLLGGSRRLRRRLRGGVRGLPRPVLFFAGVQARQGCAAQQVYDLAG